MKKTTATIIAAVLSAASSPLSAVDTNAVHAALARDVLGKPFVLASYAHVFAEVDAADSAADAAWRSLRSKAEYDARRTSMRADYLAALGAFPARTPLNATCTGVVKRDGYTVEKILFESLPGVFVTGLLYLPDPAAHKPPYPAFLIPCGHSGNGKGSAAYQRGAVMGALSGMAAFIFDPIAQGERAQIPSSRSCAAHNRIGALAALTGGGMARYRVWDAIRAVDFLVSRPEVDSGRIGCMGNSGGGTVTALVAAADPRIKAAAPSCYLSSLREVCAHSGPQDAEQNVFGQLAFGLNHASYVLLNANAVRIHCCRSDFFPVEGTRETYRTVSAAVEACGLDASRYGITEVTGPHGWKESLRRSSLLWMRRWLAGDRSALPIDVAACRRLDFGFDGDTADCGLVHPSKSGTDSYNVTPKGTITTLPGFRSIYEYVKDDLAAAVRNRPARTPAARRGAVRRRAGIRARSELPAPHVTLAHREAYDGFAVERLVFDHSGGPALPAVLLLPARKTPGAEPALVAGDGLRRETLTGIAAAHLQAGRAVLVADTLAAGETGHRKRRFYDAANEDEPVALMLYWLGKSLVGVRAEELVAYAGYLRDRFSAKPRVTAVGRLAIPAAHARAAEPELFSDVEIRDAPLSWEKAVETSAVYRFANVVHGALLDYDWTDLLER